MEGAALGREQRVIGSLLREGMPEPVSFHRLGDIDHEELRIDGFVKGDAHVDLGHPAHLGKDVVPDLPSGHGRGFDEPPGRRRDRGQADNQDTAEGLRQALASIAHGGDELLSGMRCRPNAARWDQREM